MHGLSIEAKKQNEKTWEVYTECGREHSGLSVEDWVKQGVDLGAGEVLINSIDMEGTEKGYDSELISLVTSNINVPVIASGGYELNDIITASDAGADGIAVADGLHYERTSINLIREFAQNSNIPVRVI